MMLKTIGILLLFVGVVFMLSPNGPGGAGSIDLSLLLGLGLAIVGVWLLQYNPVADIANDVKEGATTVLRGIRDEGDAHIENAKKHVRKAADDAESTARRRIHSMAKELDELAEK